MQESTGTKNRILNMLANLCDYIELSILTAVCCIPVLTFFISFSAGYYTYIKCFREGRASVAKTFFTYIKENFLQGFLSELGFLLYLALGFAEVFLADGLLAAGRIPNAFGVIRWLWFLPAVLVFPWMIAYEARFNDRIGTVYKNSLLLAVSGLGPTVLMGLSMVLGAVILYYFAALFIFIPMPLILVFAYFIEPVFAVIIGKTGGPSSENES